MKAGESKKTAKLIMPKAVALIIFVVELQIPNPIPISGVKLGLANTITVYTIYRFRVWEVLSVVLCRTIFGLIFSGNMMAIQLSMYPKSHYIQKPQYMALGGGFLSWNRVDSFFTAQLRQNIEIHIKTFSAAFYLFSYRILNISFPHTFLTSVLHFVLHFKEIRSYSL